MRLGAAGVASRAAGLLRSPYGVVIAAGAALQLGVLASIRIFAADPTGGDLCRDVVAAHRILRGQNPYQPIVGCGTLYNLPHPPAFLMLIGPFALLPVAWGAALWDLLGLGAIAASIWLVVWELRLRPSPRLLGLLLVLLAFWPPLLGTLLEAQISPVLLLLCTLAWWAARRGRTGWAGAALGLAAALRLFPAVAVGYFVLRRDWRATLWAVAACAGAELVALPLIGVRGFVAYLTREAPSTNAEWMVNAHNVSAWGFAGMVFAGNQVAGPLVSAPGVARLCAEALLVGVFGLLAWLTVAGRRRTFAEDEGTFLAYVPAMLLASPLTWTHYFVVLLLPILVLGGRVGWLGGPLAAARPASTALSRARWLLAATLGLIWLNDWVARMPLGGHLPAAYALLVLALPTYALFCLLAGLLLLAHGAVAGKSVEAPDAMPAAAG
jgi:Glycosyltransferase family 87